VSGLRELSGEPVDVMPVIAGSESKRAAWVIGTVGFTPRIASSIKSLPAALKLPWGVLLVRSWVSVWVASGRRSRPGETSRGAAPIRGVQPVAPVRRGLTARPVKSRPAAADEGVERPGWRLGTPATPAPAARFHGSACRPHTFGSAQPPDLVRPRCPAGPASCSGSASPSPLR
jgi:hypothetical protein